MLRLINDPQKHKILYTSELCDIIINFQCVQDFLFLWIINSKQSVLSIANLNLKCLIFFIHTVYINLTALIDLSHNDVKCGFEMLITRNLIGSGKMSSQSN